MIPVNNNSITVCYPRINKSFIAGTWVYNYELKSSSSKIVERTRHNNLIVILSRNAPYHKAIFCKRTGKCINRVGNKNTPEEFRSMFIKDFPKCTGDME